MKLPSTIMSEMNRVTETKHKVDTGVSEFINIDENEETSEILKKKKLPICERHWIFKRNKDICEHRKHRTPTDSIADVSTYYEQHRKFLEYLHKLQEGLPSDKKKDGVVDQVITDSVDIKNLFVNGTTRPKCNINLKAITGADKKSSSCTTSFQSTQSTVRSSRLFRKCRANQIIEDPEDDDDILFATSSTRTTVMTAAEREASLNKVKKEDRKPRRTATTTTMPSATTTKAKAAEENSINPLDELMNDDAFERKTKKRKVQSTIHTVHKLTSEQPQQSADTTNTKRPQRHVVNGDKKVIEIADNENEDVIVSPQKEEPKKKSKVSCPMCSKDFSPDDINDHAYTCQGPQTTRSSKDSQDAGASYDASAWENACKGLNTDSQNQSKQAVENVETENTFHKKLLFPPPKTTYSNKATYSNKSTSSNKTTLSSNYKIPKKSRNKQEEEEEEDPLVDLKAANKIRTETKSETTTKDGNQERPHINKHGRLATTNITGYQDLESDDGVRNMIEGYAKTINTLNRHHPSSKLMRSFGDGGGEESETTRCTRCDQYIPDDELKQHTDQCFDQTMLVD